MNDVFVSTLDFVPNYSIIESKGQIFSPRLNSFLQNTNTLKDIAFKMGCNAVINIKHSDGHAYGEAVIIKKNN